MRKVPLTEKEQQGDWLVVDWGGYHNIISSSAFNKLLEPQKRNAKILGKYKNPSDAFNAMGVPKLGTPKLNNFLQDSYIKQQKPPKKSKVYGPEEEPAWHKKPKGVDESMYDYLIRIHGQKAGQKIYDDWTIRQRSKNIDPRKDHTSKIKDWWGRVKTEYGPKNTGNIQSWYRGISKPKAYGPEEEPAWVDINRDVLHKSQELDSFEFTRNPYNANTPIEEVELNRKGEVVSYKVKGRKIPISKYNAKQLEALANSNLIRGPKNKIESKNMQDQWTRLQSVVFDKKGTWRKRVSIFARIQSAQWSSRSQISWTRAYRQNYTKNILREWVTDKNKVEDYWLSLFGEKQYHSMRTAYEKARAQYNKEGGFFRSNDYYSMLVKDDLSRESKRRIAKSYIASHLFMELGHKVSPKTISNKQADDELRKNNPGLQADIDIEKQTIRYNLNDIGRSRDIALINTLAYHPLQRAKNVDKNIDYSQYRSGNAPYKQFFQEAPKGFHVPKKISRRDITYSEFKMARDLFVKERSKDLIKEYTGEAKAQRAQESIKLFEDKIKDLEQQREARIEGLRLTLKSKGRDLNKVSHLIEDDDTLKVIARKLTMAQKDLEEATATAEELRSRIRLATKGDYTRARFGAGDDWKKELKTSRYDIPSLHKTNNRVGTKKYSRPIVVYDVETGPAEEILSVSAAKFVIDKKTNKLIKVDTFNRFYYPIKEDASVWNSEAIRVNGLTPDVIKAYRKNDHAKYSERYDAGERNALLKFIGENSVLVGQNSHDFDNMRAFGGHLPGIDTVDTMDVARGFRGTTTGDVDEWKIHNDLETLVRWADWERTKRYSKYGGKGRTMEELGFSHHLSEHDIVATAFVFETMVNMKNEAGNALRFVLNNPGHNFGPYDSMVKSLIYKGAYKRTPKPGSYVDRRLYNMSESDDEVKYIDRSHDMTEDDSQLFDVDEHHNRIKDVIETSSSRTGKSLENIGNRIGMGEYPSSQLAEADVKNLHEAKLIEIMESLVNMIQDYEGVLAAGKGTSSGGADSATKFANKIQNLRGRGVFTDEVLTQLSKIDSGHLNPDYALSQAVAGVKAADTLSKKQIKNDVFYENMIDQVRDENFGEFHDEWANRIAQRGRFFGQGDKVAQQQYYDNLMSYFDFYNNTKEAYRKHRERAIEARTPGPSFPYQRGTLQERFDSRYWSNPEFRERVNNERFKDISSFAEKLSADNSHDPRGEYLERFERAEKNIPGSHTTYANSVWDEFNKSLKEANENINDFGDRLSAVSSTIAEFTPGKSQFYDPRITSEAAEKGYMGAMAAADFLPRSFQKNLQRLGDAGFRQLQVRQSGFGTWLDIAHSSGIGMQNSMKRAGGFVGEKIGSHVGGPAGGELGKQLGKSSGNALGWGINFGSQIRGRLEKRFVENQFAQMQSTFDLMSLAKDYLIAPFKILSTAVKTLSSLFKNLSVSIVNFMSGALQNMGKLGTPLTTMTGIGYSQYQGLGAMDRLFGFGAGTLNGAFESTAQQAQLLYSTGQFNQERLIASARLGVFNQTYGRNASFEDIVNGLMSKPVTKERMALAGQIDSSLPAIMQVMSDIGVTNWEDFKNPSNYYNKETGQTIGWHAISDDANDPYNRTRMRRSYYEYSAIQENIGNTKMRAGQWLWTHGGGAIMNGVNEALDTIVSGGDWGQAWLKLKTPILKAWDSIKKFFGVAFENTDTLWQKIKKFGAAVWDKISDALGIESGKGPIESIKEVFGSIFESIVPTMVKGIIMIENLWTAAFQSIVKSAAPILDNFFDYMSRMRIDPLALVYQSTLGKDDLANRAIQGLLGKNHTQFISFATEEDKYNTNIKNKKSQLGYYDLMSESSKGTTVSPYFEAYRGAPGSPIEYKWTKHDYNGKKAFVFANSAMPSDVELNPANDSKGYLLSSDEYARSAFYDVYKNVQARYHSGNDAGNLKYTLADGKGHTWSTPAIKDESVEAAFARAQQEGLIEEMTGEVRGKSHLFSEQIVPGIIEATNYIDESVLPGLLEDIIGILEKGLGVKIDVTNKFDKNGKPTGTSVSATDSNGNNMKDTVQSVQVDRVYTPSSWR